MTSKELLGCLKDRPCSVCKFRDEEGCHKWNCVFEEPTDDVEFDSVIEDIKAEIEKELCHSIRDEYSQRQNDYCDGVEFAGKRCLEIIDRHIGDKADETN